MKVSEVKAICRHLLPSLPDFIQKGRMLYDVQSNGLLRGIYFEDSGFDKNAFYVWAFFLPLYVPTTHVSFTFGRRIAAGKRWSMASDSTADLAKAIFGEALPFLQKATTAEQFVNEISGITENLRDPYVIQARAYSFAKSDNVAAAVSELKRLVAVLSTIDAKAAWVGEMLSRAQDLSEHVGMGTSYAKELLGDWEAVSRKNLRLI